MFSVRQKREISDKIQAILRETNHPELPKDEIKFSISILGAESWSYALIQNNGAVITPNVNPHNERMDPNTLNKEEAIEAMEQGYKVAHNNFTSAN